MDTSKMLRPEQLPFDVPKLLAESINDLIAAIERDDKNLDGYLDDVAQSARMVSEEEDMWLRHYYYNWGWLDD